MNRGPELSADFLMILTTVDDPKKAEMIAGELVRNNAAACVQIEGPITSVYTWQGKVETSVEYRLVVKTAALSESRAYSLIRENHPYDLPQIVTVPIISGWKPYFDWIQQETNK